jgi:hypothetical protein
LTVLTFAGCGPRVGPRTAKIGAGAE